jgi:hypothetical protein
MVESVATHDHVPSTRHHTVPLGAPGSGIDGASWSAWRRHRRRMVECDATLDREPLTRPSRRQSFDLVRLVDGCTTRV